MKKQFSFSPPMVSGLRPLTPLQGRLATCCFVTGAWIFLLGGGVGAGAVVGGEIAIKDGQKVAFMGDSITKFGWANPHGYVRLVVAGLKSNGITVASIPAGVPGDTSKDELGRLKLSVLDEKPDWMTLSCGVNDVSLRPEKHVSLEQFKINITRMIDQAQAAGIKVLILTPTGNGEDLQSEQNKNLVLYCEFLSALAKERGLRIADLNSDVRAVLRANPRQKLLLTVDGTHMNPKGDELMATGVLKAFGLNAEQLAKARETWAGMPVKAGK